MAFKIFTFLFIWLLVKVIKDMAMVAHIFYLRTLEAEAAGTLGVLCESFYMLSFSIAVTAQ